MTQPGPAPTYRPSQWDDATLRLLILLIQEYYMLFGSFPTVAQVKAELVKHAA